ncbi:MAG: PSD1 and planctomycete cytochrome C domain-containing protein [Verrucomicrobiota bacterium]
MIYNSFHGLPSRSIVAVWGWLALSAPLQAAVDYMKEIKPLLRERCFACHGALKQKADLRLDSAQSIFQGGKSGPALTRGNAGTSLILQRLESADPDEKMPPAHEGEPFTPAQISLLRQWIADGAPAPSDDHAETDPRDHWSFRPLVRPAVPVVANAAWVRNPIDAFVARQQEVQGLTPQSEAPPEVLLRRLYLDLIGLPPAPAAMDGLLREVSTDGYERIVQQLLGDPRHGERWARHWMDIWRYSDWWGLGDQLRNSQKHMWHWRDWIVESLNAGLPYDEMLRQMLAADELYPGDLKKVRATGFLARNFFLFNRNPWMEETVEHVSKGLLGLTMNCSKCHDHKYDPIPQNDYYRLRAFFEPYQVRLDAVEGVTDPNIDGIPRVYDGQPDLPTWRFIRGEENRPDKSAAIPPAVPAFLAIPQPDIRPVTLPPEAWQPERQPWVIPTQLASAQRNMTEAVEAAALAVQKNSGAPAADQAAASVAQAELNTARQRVTWATAEWDSVRSRADAMRAAWEQAASAPDKRRAAVRAERLAAAAKARHGLAEAEAQLAQAVPDKKPEAEKAVTTAREASAAAEKTAAGPVEPDAAFTPIPGARWTPTRFLNSSADDPAVTFPEHSTGRRSALAAWITDARNPLTARVAANHLWARHMGTPLVATVFDFGRNGAQPTHPELLDWLASELISSGWNMKHLHGLIVTSATWRLSSSAAGAAANAAKDPDNLHLWRRHPVRLEAEVLRDSLLALSGELDPAPGGPPIPPAEQNTSKRRSLYFFNSNNERNLFLTTFDAAAVKECYRRDQSIVPQQALALTNSGLVQDAAEKIAAHLAQTTGPADAAPDDTAFIRQAFLLLLGISASDAETAACSRALEAWRALPAGTGGDARIQLIRSLLNHNDFVTLR